jgi:FeS assembly protein SufD
MDTQVRRTKAEEAYVSQFETGLDDLPGDQRVRKLRTEAFDRFSAAGLPNRRVEEWKYTDLRASLGDAFLPAPVLGEVLSAAQVDAALGGGLSALDCHRIVVVDGNFRPELSDVCHLGGKAEVLPLADSLSQSPDWLTQTLGQVNPQDRDPIVALNTALMSGGIALRIADGAKIEKPVHLVHVAAANKAASVATRNVVVVGAGAGVTLLESYTAHSSAPMQRNVVTELVAGDKSEVHHVKFQAETLEAAHLSTWMTRLGAEVSYKAFQFSVGAGLARNQIFVRFAGEGSSSHVSGAVLARDKQHNDTTLVIDHAAPACESREFNKLVLDREARGIVQCKVNVHRDAQKSDGHQMAQALMLSETAEFDSKPELEIFADDVVCGHGSTSGQVDDELLFYFRARGIPEAQARALLVAAFIGEAVDKVENEELRQAFQDLAETWLSGEGGR